MSQIQATILAAGSSTRFQSPYTKLIAPICGKPMLAYPVDMLHTLTIPTTIVVGYQAEYVQNALPDDPLITYVEQKEQRGTGHALLCGYHNSRANHMLVLNGDTPLITQELINTVINTHVSHDAAITFVTADNRPEAYAYGKVVTHGNHIEIIEARHITDQTQHTEINAGIYLFNSNFLETALQHLAPHSGSNEIYITDLIGYASQQNYTVNTVHADFDTIRGVNTLEELQIAEQKQQTAIINNHVHHGVYCVDPDNTYIDANVQIAEHTRIEPGAIIRGNTTIGSGCHIGPYTVINNSTIGDHVQIEPYSHIADTTIDAAATIGPFARTKKQTHIQTGATIGNFVETAASTIGPKAKAKHLAYIGNTTVAEKVNIGAGTVICNYDGYAKHTTHIQHGTFIGSNTTLVAPLHIGSEAIIAAGSVITKDVPNKALAIARERETIKDNYAPYLQAKQRGTLHHDDHAQHEQTG